MEIDSLNKAIDIAKTYNASIVIETTGVKKYHLSLNDKSKTPYYIENNCIYIFNNSQDGIKSINDYAAIISCIDINDISNINIHIAKSTKNLIVAKEQLKNNFEMSDEEISSFLNNKVNFDGSNYSPTNYLEEKAYNNPKNDRIIVN